MPNPPLYARLIDADPAIGLPACWQTGTAWFDGAQLYVLSNPNPIQKENKMKAFLNDPQVKEMYLSRVKAHYAADEIIHGTYWQNGKGCAVGCTIHSDRHNAYETELGIPMILAKLEDRIFEGMGNGEAKEFPVRFLSAIRVGADLSLVWSKFAVWLLVDENHGVIRHAKTDGQRKAINDVAVLYKKQARGEFVTISQWQKVRIAAADAAAYAAAYAAAAAAADAAAYAAAADDAADAADAADTARKNAYTAQSNQLVKLLAAA